MSGNVLRSMGPGLLLELGLQSLWEGVCGQSGEVVAGWASGRDTQQVSVTGGRPDCAGVCA